MATRETKESLLQRIALQEESIAFMREDLAKARERTKEVEAQRDDMRDLWHREQADHMLTLGNLKDQTRIAGLLAVGGKTSYQPQIEDRLEKNMTARAGCAPRHRG